MIIQHDNIYEHIVRLETNTAVFKPFNSKERGIKDIVKIYKSNCKTIRNELGAIVYDTLLDLYETPIDYVINYNLKLVGFYIETLQMYCPLPFDENLNQFTPRGKVRYFDALPVNEVISFDQLTHIDDFYKGKNKVYFDILHDYLKVFVGYQEESYDPIDILSIQAYDAFIKSTLEDISKVDLMNISLIRHELNPYPTTEKIDDIKSVLCKSCEENAEHKDFLNALAIDTYNQGIEYLLKSIHVDLVVNVTERVYNASHVKLVDLISHYVQSENPYKYIENSIEDLVKFTRITQDNVVWNEEYVTHVAHSMLPEQKIYDSLKSNMRVVDLPLEKAFSLLVPSFDPSSFKADIFKRLCKRYTTSDNKSNIRQVLNYYKSNIVKHGISSIGSDVDAIYIENKDNFKSLINDNRYHMGIIESMKMAKDLKVGLILFSRNKSVPKKSIHMKITNHMIALVPNANSDEYLFIYANERHTHKIKLMCSINLYDSYDMSYIHSIKDPMIFNDIVASKLTKILTKSELSPAIQLVSNIIYIIHTECIYRT